MERRKEPKRKDGEIQGQGKEEGPRRTPGAHVGSGEQPLMSSMGHSPWGARKGVRVCTQVLGRSVQAPHPEKEETHRGRGPRA